MIHSNAVQEVFVVGAIWVRCFILYRFHYPSIMRPSQHLRQNNPRAPKLIPQNYLMYFYTLIGGLPMFPPECANVLTVGEALGLFWRCGEASIDVSRKPAVPISIKCRLPRVAATKPWSILWPQALPLVAFPLSPRQPRKILYRPTISQRHCTSSIRNQT